MTLTPLQAHLLCLGLVGLDQAARAVRIRMLVRAVGQDLSLRDALATNAIGEVACALTPMRLGGEPARLAGLLRAGVPAGATFVAIALEVLTAWPVIVTSALALGFWFAPGWVEQSAPELLRGLRDLWVWLAVAGVACVALWILVRRSVHIAPRVTRRPWRRVLVYWRRIAPLPIVVATACAFVNLASRTAILPVLMATLVDPPPLGPAILGSFALLYSQLVIPTPSGAGVVDVGLLAGAAGAGGGVGVALLVWWRFYTTVVGAGLGVWFAIRDFGWSRVRQAMRRKGRSDP